MAILIKDMEMPESCFLCRFCRRHEYGEYIGEDTAWEYVASKKRITDGHDLIATFKHPDCPFVEVLPYAQPDIIRCEDCKWYGRADKRRFYRGMDCLQKRIDTIVPDKDFCSKAERRTDEND